MNCYLYFYLIPVPTTIMSIDKFGRYSGYLGASTATQGPRGPKGDGFHLTDIGDYDVQYKRICNLGTPTESEDAVNLNTLRASVAKCLSKNDKNMFDVNGHKLCNLIDPENDGDAINKKYFTNNSPIKLIDSYSFHQFRIQDVASPSADGDAINFTTFKNKALISDDKGFFNAKHLRISNMNDPQVGQDAVNLHYLQKNSLILKETKDSSGRSMKLLSYDANNHMIKNLSFPRKRADAINYTFLADILTNMSFAIYSNMNNKKKQKITKEEWKQKVGKSLYDCDWGDLFGISENALVQPVNDVPETSKISSDEAETNSQS